MAHTDKHARRLLSGLEPYLPDDAERVLDSCSYWDPGFCDLFLERTKELIFCDPQAGLKVARVATRLAHSLPEGQNPESRQQHRAHLVKAYAVLGSACRAAGRPDAAEEQFRAATRFCRGAGVPRSTRAELFWRFAELRAYQKRFDEALKFATNSLKLYKTEGDQEGEGVALATRGAVYALARRFSQAVSTLSEVLSTYKLPPRVEYSATHNLGYAISQAGNPDLASALRHLHRAKQLLGPRASVQKSKLYWLEGIIYLRHGSAFVERGELRMQKARAGFLKFQVPYEIALVGLDLSALYRFQKRWSELGALAADTHQRFRELREDSEALAALKLWLEAVQSRSLSEELLFEVKTTLEARMRREGTTRRCRNRG